MTDRTTDGQLAPLSDARLAEILAANLKPRYRDAITALLAERERLLAVVAEAQPFLRELADAHTSFVDDDDVIIKVNPGRAAWVISRAKVFIEKVEQAHAALAAAPEKE